MVLPNQTIVKTYYQFKTPLEALSHPTFILFENHHGGYYGPNSTKQCFRAGSIRRKPP